jgi:hypothetical protein
MERKWIKTTASTLALLAVLAGNTVSAFAAENAGDPARLIKLVGEDVLQGEIVTTEGIIVQTQGAFTVEGWTLAGNAALLESLKGQQVWVLGTKLGAGQTVKVERIERAVAMNRVMPKTVTINGKAVQWDQAPYMQKGTLMLPLRAVVEAAGGKIDWQQETWSAQVLLSDRTATFTVDKNQAEMYLHAARYFTRNFLPMDQSVVLVGGRLFISADALTNVLGMVEEVTADESVLALRFPGQQFHVPGEPEYTIPATEEITFDLKWDGTLLQISGKAHVPDLQFVVKLNGQVIAQADTTVKEGQYTGNVIVEGGATQAGQLELLIIDPATGRELASMPLGK